MRSANGVCGLTRQLGGRLFVTRDLALDLEDALDQRLRTRWATAEVNVHGQDLVHTLDDGRLTNRNGEEREGR